MVQLEEIEHSIITKYRKSIWAPFIKAVKELELIQENDKIAVCISGGKDSMLLAKCMQELKRHGKVPFDLVFLVMDPGYTESNRQQIIENAAALNIPITMFETQIFDSVATMKDNPCYICARMRRGYLYHRAQDLGCNKIALGHHFDDVIETILLSMLYGGEFKTMMPKLHSENYEGMELIRPLYFVKEQDIISWREYHHLTFLNCACRFTEQCAISDDNSSKRQEMKHLINQFRKTSSYIEQNIFKSAWNVNLDTVLGYHQKEEKHFFLDDYDTKK